MKLIEENFKDLNYNSATFEKEDGKLVIISPYISDERWAEIKKELAPKLEAAYPKLLEKFGKK